MQIIESASVKNSTIYHIAYIIINKTLGKKSVEICELLYCDNIRIINLFNTNTKPIKPCLLLRWINSPLISLHLCLSCWNSKSLQCVSALRTLHISFQLVCILSDVSAKSVLLVSLCCDFLYIQICWGGLKAWYVAILL